MTDGVHWTMGKAQNISKCPLSDKVQEVVKNLFQYGDISINSASRINLSWATSVELVGICMIRLQLILCSSQPIVLDFYGIQCNPSNDVSGKLPLINFDFGYYSY